MPQVDPLQRLEANGYHVRLDEDADPPVLYVERGDERHAIHLTEGYSREDLRRAAHQLQQLVGRQPLDEITYLHIAHRNQLYGFVIFAGFSFLGIMASAGIPIYLFNRAPFWWGFLLALVVGGGVAWWATYHRLSGRHYVACFECGAGLAHEAMHTSDGHYRRLYAFRLSCPHCGRHWDIDV